MISGRVGFEEFKEGFVQVLSNSVLDENPDSHEDLLDGADTERDVSEVFSDHE